MEVKFGGFRFVDTQQPFSRQPFSGAHESRERYALSGRQPIFLHPFHGATELRKQYAVAGLGISRSAERGNGPLARRAQKGRDTYGLPVGH